MKIQNASTKRLLLALFCAQALVLVNCDEDDPDESDSGVDAGDAALPDGGITLDGAAPDSATAPDAIDAGPPNDSEEIDSGVMDAWPTVADAAIDTGVFIDASPIDAGADVYVPEPIDAGSDASEPSPTLFSLGGSVSGILGSGLVLYGGPSNYVAISKNGAYTLPLKVPNGAYDVSAYFQPKNPSQTCVVANATGTVAGSNVTNLDVTCTTDTFPITVTVSGLTGPGLVLKNNTNGQTLSIDASGAYSFTAPVASGVAFEITIASQPSNGAQSCKVASNGSGTVTTGAPPTITVTCASTTLGKNTFNPPPRIVDKDLYAPLACTSDTTALLGYMPLNADNPCGTGKFCSVKKVEPTENWTATGHFRFDSATRVVSVDITPDRDLMQPYAYGLLSTTYGVDIGAATANGARCGKEWFYTPSPSPQTCLDSSNYGYVESSGQISAGVSYVDGAKRGKYSAGGKYTIVGSAIQMTLTSSATRNTNSYADPSVEKTTTNKCVGVTQ